MRGASVCHVICVPRGSVRWLLDGHAPRFRVLCISVKILILQEENFKNWITHLVKKKKKVWPGVLVGSVVA